MYESETNRKLTFGDIKVEEVTVQDSLYHTGHNGDHVEEAFEVETPDPVEEIESPIHAQAEQVVGGDCFRLAGLADHKELRQDCHRLQVDGEGPQDLMTDTQNTLMCRKRNSHSGQAFINELCHTLTAAPEVELTSRKEKSWLMRTARPPTGTTRNSTLKLSWLPS